MPDDRPVPGSPEDWLRHAHADLALARSPVGPDDLFELHCFHAQQAVEKSLKAILLKRGLRIPRTHVIQSLLDALSAVMVVPDDVVAASSLTLYASEVRYPRTEEPVTEEELEESLRLADVVEAWAIGIVRQ